MVFAPQRINVEALKDHVRAKWPDDLLAEGFVPFPKALLRALPQLYGGSEPAEELAVILALADYRRRNMRTFASVEYLAFLAGMQPDAFQRALERLKAKSWAEEPEGSCPEGMKTTTEGLARAVREALGFSEKPAKKRRRL